MLGAGGDAACQGGMLLGGFARWMVRFTFQYVSGHTRVADPTAGGPCDGGLPPTGPCSNRYWEGARVRELCRHSFCAIECSCARVKL